MIGVHVLECTRDGIAKRNFLQILDDVKFHDARKLEYPHQPSKVIISGSRSSVNSDAAWIKKLKKQVKQYITDDVDILGVCFGHQLIADVMGGEVTSMEGIELGYTEVTTDNISLYDGLDMVEHPFVSHGDKVVEIPEELVVTAESQRCIHGFSHEAKNIYGIQFHPEFDINSVKQLIREKDISEERTHQLISSVDKDQHSKSTETRQIFQNFVKL